MTFYLVLLIGSAWCVSILLFVWGMLGSKQMSGSPLSRVSDCRPHRAPRPAFADGPVADTAETVTAQAGIVGAEPDRDDGHTMGHTE